MAPTGCKHWYYINDPGRTGGASFHFVVIISLHDPVEFKRKALQWASAFKVCCYLDSNNFREKYSRFDCLVACGVKAELISDAGNAFERLKEFRQENPGWLTGFLGYDLKNETEQLSSKKADRLKFPDLYFFVPQYTVVVRGAEAELIADDPQRLYKAIQDQNVPVGAGHAEVEVQTRFAKAAYLETVAKIKEYIARGDIYVTNFCQEFFAENAVINPLDVFVKLNEVSPNPFSAFFRHDQQYILCASPERFLAKRKNKLISQPIKGTAPRGANKTEDEAIKKRLKAHTKEQQENVMIVDLVRNDLTKSARPGTVKTEELFGIYSFSQVHQMISTVVCELDEQTSAVKALKNAFPMGSMTGAPKISAMRLMEQYERSKRGVYSGAIGYFSPDGDFDFNVVIRTILYDSAKRYLSFQAGSAITFHADAENEYEECLLKITAIKQVLSAPSPG